MINNDARNYASLSAGLLARKGAARPAMRPQGYGQHHGFDDLGSFTLSPVHAVTYGRRR